MAKVQQRAVGHITITGLKEPQLEALARVTQNAYETSRAPRKVSQPSRHALTRDALDTVMVWRDRYAKGLDSPLSKLDPARRSLLTSPEAAGQLDELDQAISAAAAVQIDTPLLQALKIEALSSPNATSIAACAAAVSEAYTDGNTKGVLTIGELLAACHEMEASELAGFRPSQAFDSALACPDFTKKNLEALRIYMVLGLGGLANHGTIEAHGIKCHRVFQLPMLDEITLPDGKPYAQQSGDKQRAILTDTVTAYETQFARTGFDRIYVRGDDNKLYVGIIDEGSISALGPGAIVAFNDPSRPFQLGQTRQLGKLLRAVDVNNTKHEATVVFWSRTFANWGERLNGVFRDASERPVSAITALSANLKSDAKAPAAAAGGAAPWFAAVGLAGMAAAIPNTQTLLTVLGLGAAVVGVFGTGLSLWSLTRTGKDIAPFLGATGHVVTRSGIRSDEI